MNTMTLEKFNNQTSNIVLPVFDKPVSCGFTGFPSPATDYEEKELHLENYLGIKKNKTWLFVASGNSLKDLGILDKDVLIVDTSVEAQLGDLCICLCEGEYLAKIVDLIKGIPHLLSANKEHPPVRIDSENEFQIFGVVTGRAGKINRLRK